jgi:hypothetical protein
VKLITLPQRKQLIKNGTLSARARLKDGNVPDFEPVVKLFSPDGNATWLLTEIDPVDNDTAFGLCDLGQGFPELGSVSLKDLMSYRGPLRLPLERDIHFAATKGLSEYANDARANRRITA